MLFPLGFKLPRRSISDDYQDQLLLHFNIVLWSRVWVDEIYVDDTELSKSGRRAHGVLVRENSLEDESYKTDVHGRARLKAMELVNNLCSWLK